MNSSTILARKSVKTKWRKMGLGRNWGRACLYNHHEESSAFFPLSLEKRANVKRLTKRSDEMTQRNEETIPRKDESRFGPPFGLYNVLTIVHCLS